MHNDTTQTARVARVFGNQNKVDHISYPADIKLFYSSEPRFITTKSPLTKVQKSGWHQNLQLRFSPELVPV